jgi:hypothetical protein
MRKIQQELEERNKVIFAADVPLMCAQAAQDVSERLQTRKSAL